MIIAIMIIQFVIVCASVSLGAFIYYKITENTKEVEEIQTNAIGLNINTDKKESEETIEKNENAPPTLEEQFNNLFAYGTEPIKRIKLGDE